MPDVGERRSLYIRHWSFGLLSAFDIRPWTFSIIPTPASRHQQDSQPHLKHAKNRPDCSPATNEPHAIASTGRRPRTGPGLLPDVPSPETDPPASWPDSA